MELSNNNNNNNNSTFSNKLMRNDNTIPTCSFHGTPTGQLPKRSSSRSSAISYLPTIDECKECEPHELTVEILPKRGVRFPRTTSLSPVNFMNPTDLKCISSSTSTKPDRIEKESTTVSQKITPSSCSIESKPPRYINNPKTTINFDDRTGSYFFSSNRFDLNDFDSELSADVDFLPHASTGTIELLISPNQEQRKERGIFDPSFANRFDL